MAIRKFTGVGLGLALSLLLTVSALGVTYGPFTATSKTPGWNTPTYNMNSHSFGIRRCVTDPDDDYLWFESMHHWPFTPSTGIGKQLLFCNNDDTWRTISWSASQADYSIEYVRMCCYNSATIVTTSWRIID